MGFSLRLEIGYLTPFLRGADLKICPTKSYIEISDLTIPLVLFPRLAVTQWSIVFDNQLERSWKGARKKNNENTFKNHQNEGDSTSKSHFGLYSVEV